MLRILVVFFVSFGHSKSFGLLKQTKRDQAWLRPFEPAIPHRLQQHFSPFAVELAAARKRVLAQTGFAILYLF